MKSIYCLSILSYLLAGSIWAGDLKISYTTDKPANTIGPDEDVVKMTLTVRNDDKPVDAKLHIVLDSPEVNSVVSTDFPIVEGSRLFDATAVTENGKFEMSYLFPIRGEYKLNVTAETLGAEPTAAAQSFTFKLNENPGEVRNFYIMIASLIGFGLISGATLSIGAIRNMKMKAAA